MATHPNHPLPLRRHDSAAQLTTNTKPQAPQPLATPFPCSHRRHLSRNKPLATCPNPPPSPPPQPPKQDRLQTALLYLARAAAQLPPTSTLAGSLYDFAAPNWTLERWEGQVKRERGCGVAAVAVVAAAVGARGEWAEFNGEAKSEVCTADGWVRRAVGVLRREGEEGEYWRDGRDLEVLWRRVGGDCE